MKKLLAMLLGSAIAVTSVAGLAACGKKGGGKLRDDSRVADAYQAYDHTGASIGGYKTIAEAINATVKADAGYFSQGDDVVLPGSGGGYVTKKGDTRKLFENRKGYAAGNSDCFWYYENGSELTGFNCWDAANSISVLRNAKTVVHEVTEMGTTSAQTWNGYGLLDAHGEENNTATPQSWELSSTMDAGAMMFPVRKQGVSGLRYKLDFSDVKITPSYKGVDDKTYAFTGFYAWQDYYVIALGIACDTSTGDWYLFEGTSRDNSFCDVQYNIGEKLFSSKWTKSEDGGYFAPQMGELEMRIQTMKRVDEITEEVYWEDELVFTTKDGELTKVIVDDEMVNRHFANYAVSADNGYVFIAGLDIKNPSPMTNTVENADYFNGARFLDLAVTEAAVYFPTEEEMTQEEYAIGDIPEEFRGIWHDVLLANDEETPGTYDYTILANYLCSSYEARDSVDYYSFRFDGDPTSENFIGGALAEHQKTIDGLADMTADNIDDYLEDYMAENFPELAAYVGDIDVSSPWNRTFEMDFVLRRKE